MTHGGSFGGIAAFAVAELDEATSAPAVFEEITERSKPPPVGTRSHAWEYPEYIRKALTLQADSAWVETDGDSSSCERETGLRQWWR